MRETPTRQDTEAVSGNLVEESVQAEPPTSVRESEKVPATDTPTLLQSAVTWLRNRTVEQWVYTVVFAVGAILRLVDLQAKPLHHDESLHAYYALQFMVSPSSYLYDPLLHGPFQFHIIPIFYVIGALLHASGGGANDFTVRLLPALMGMAMIVMPYWLRQELGKWGALTMAVLMAISPSFVYYSRFVRDDIYVTCCTLLLVVAAVRYAQTRKLVWLLLCPAALTISYTAMENTFFIIAVFGSFLVGLLLWDLGTLLGNGPLKQAFAPQDRNLAGRLILIGPFLLVMAVLAYFGLHALSTLSDTINSLAATHSGPTDPLNPDVTIKGYEEKAVGILLVISILISAAVIVGLLRQLNTTHPLQNRGFWRRWINPERQPVLDAILSTHWIRWFGVFITAWVIFVIFFWKLPANAFSLTEWGTGFENGIGRGLLHGIYYWLTQQHVARGGQPWYYYLVLIPLYEPLILLFGVAGLVRCLLAPTRFRLFLVYWFVANLVLYSWAGEKMPWLIVHIMLPLIALAAVAGEWIIGMTIKAVQQWWTPSRGIIAGGLLAFVVTFAFTLRNIPFVVGSIFWLGMAVLIALVSAWGYDLWRQQQARRLGTTPDRVLPDATALHIADGKRVLAVIASLLAVVLFIPTVWNMYQVTFMHPADAPQEMLIYVQTTNDVEMTMQKVALLDKTYAHGTKTLPIGVTEGTVWPMVWYLHDYTSVYYRFTPGASNPPPVIIADMDGSAQNISATYPDKYISKQLRLRWWWDESYKLPACSPTKTSQCTTQATWDSGVGPLEWISYGAYPPQRCGDLKNPACNRLNTPPDWGQAATRYWNWLWLRQNISGTQPGSTDFMLFISKDYAKTATP